MSRNTESPAGGFVIVCHCNALRECQVRAAARHPAEAAEAVYARLGCAPRCGQCLPFARSVIADEYRELRAA